MSVLKIGSLNQESWVHRTLDEERKFSRVKTPVNDSWSMSDEPTQVKPKSHRPRSPVRSPVSPRVKNILAESAKTQTLSPRSPRSLRNAYKPEAMDEAWVPSCLHGGFSKNDSWAYREGFGKKYFLSSNVINNSFKKK